MLAGRRKGWLSSCAGLCLAVLGDRTDKHSYGLARVVAFLLLFSLLPLPSHRPLCQGVWKFLRERKDKLTPNHIRVYKKVLQSIRDDIKYEELEEMIADSNTNSAVSSSLAYFACFEAKPPNQGVSLRLIKQELIGRKGDARGAECSRVDAQVAIARQLLCLCYC